MLELARVDVEHPYTGGETAFYDYVRRVRRARKQTPGDLAQRFEGVAKDVNDVSWRRVGPSLRALSLYLYCPTDLTEHALRPDKD